MFYFNVFFLHEGISRKKKDVQKVNFDSFIKNKDYQKIGFSKEKTTS